MKKLKALAVFLLMFSCYAWGREHVVQRGETFESIASSYGVGVQEILELNPKVKTCHVGMKLSIPEAPMRVAETDVTVGNNSESSRKQNSEKKKVDGWKIAGAIVNLLADVTETYVQTQNNMNRSAATSYVPQQQSPNYSNQRQTQQRVVGASGEFRTRNGQNVKFLVAKDGVLTVSNLPNVVKRYQEHTPLCLVDYQITENGDTYKTGYYKCRLCQGTTLCNVCKGKGVMPSTGALCICNGSGRCSCAGPDGDSGFIIADKDYFPGWSLSFHYIYDKNGKKVAGENYVKKNLEYNEQLEKDLDKAMSECKSCNGTGINPHPFATYEHIDLVGHYNESGDKCPYCNEVKEHWHIKCMTCMGKLKTLLMK